MINVSRKICITALSAQSSLQYANYWQISTSAPRWYCRFVIKQVTVVSSTEFCDEFDFEALQRKKSRMRLFFVVKTTQMINTYVVIALLVGTYRLCGKASLDRVLSHPNSACMRYIQHPFLRDTLASNERNNDPQNSNNTISSQDNGNKSMEAPISSVSTTSSSEETAKMRGFLESFSCIEIDLRDLSCFFWKNPEQKTPCQAASGLTFPPLVVALDLMFLIYTMVSVSRHVLPPSKAADFVRCIVHIILWCIASISKMYLLYTWEHSWKFIDFKAKIPMQSYLALILSVANVIIYCAEIFYGKWLYMRVRLLSKPDKAEEPYERSSAGNSTGYRGGAHSAKPKKGGKPEEHLLIPNSANI